tara:strand:+ start:11005 stop:11385 length:381 start_codon:yes stop_codon:yes gene_type:complete
MNIPENLQYTENHEWVLLKGDMAIVGVTDYAQGELGDVVYVDVDTIGQILNVGDVFGSVEAVKTVSDLFMPISGTVEMYNDKLESNPELVNQQPYDDGWIVKVRVSGDFNNQELLSADQYKNLIGE